MPFLTSTSSLLDLESLVLVYKPMWLQANSIIVAILYSHLGIQVLGDFYCNQRQNKLLPVDAISKDQQQVKSLLKLRTLKQFARCDNSGKVAFRVYQLPIFNVFILKQQSAMLIGCGRFSWLRRERYLFKNEQVSVCSNVSSRQAAEVKYVNKCKSNQLKTILLLSLLLHARCVTIEDYCLRPVRLHQFYFLHFRD